MRFPAASRTGKNRTAWPERPRLMSVVFALSTLFSPSMFQPNDPLGLNVPAAGFVDDPLVVGSSDCASPVWSWKSQRTLLPCGYQPMIVAVGCGGETV